MWPRWYVLNRNRFAKFAAVLVIIVVVLWWASSFLSGIGQSDKELLDSALTNTINSSSYRYTVEVKQNGKDTITMVEGVKVKPNRVHIKGTMQKSQMEFIQIDDTTYMKDPWSNRWFTLKGNSLEQADLFFAEFNPMGLFSFKDVPYIKRLDTEKLDGVKTVVLEIRPNIANPFLELKYSDYIFKVWIDPREKVFRRGVMQAFLPGGAEGLLVDMKFMNFNEKAVIEPPAENSQTQ